MMTGKLEIQNGSLTSDVFISLLSIDGREKHLDNKVINAGNTISSIVKGGTKRLIIRTNDKDIVWEGAIPTYISQPIIIYPEYNTVIYKDNTIPNTIVKEKFNTITLLSVSVLTLIILYCVYIYLR